MSNPANSNSASVGDSIPMVGLLNDCYTGGTDIGIEEKSAPLSSFTPFSRLPVEIASLIWKQVLMQTRLISITVMETDSDDQDRQVVGRNRLGRAVSAKDYWLQVTTHLVPTPLLQATRDSRRAVFEFYRVQIPYDRADSHEHCLGINPELDYLSLRIEGPDGSSEVLTDFIHDLKAYDPRGIGIRNLGIESRGFTFNIALPSDPTRINPEVCQSFIEVISGLEYIFFHCIPHGDTRIMFDSLDMQEVVFNRSYPIHSSAEVFEFVGLDPRPIEACLDKVGIGRDPRSLYWIWKQMELKFDINHDPGKTKFVYHLTAPAWGQDGGAISRDNALQQLQLEERLWRSHWEKNKFWGRNGYDDPDTPENLSQTPVPAFGFWILPYDALGGIPEEAPRYWDNKMVGDLSKCRPQLAVSRLPRN